MLRTEFQLIFAATAAVMMALQWKPPTPAYPPTSAGDNGAVSFLFTVGVLGGITAFIGGLSACNCFNRLAKKGPKRRFLRYTSPCVDVIFLALAAGAIAVSTYTHSLGFSLHPFCILMPRLIGWVLQLARKDLDAGATDCLANLGTYQGCTMLMVAVVMVGLGGLMAFICCVLETCRIKKRK